MVDISTRAATANDVGFLRDMLFEALYVPPGGEQLPRSVIDQPELAHYVDGFGRPGDVGVIAFAGSEPVGAAWVRVLTGSDAGYGHVDDETPELTIAVTDEWRGRGVGSRLIDELVNTIVGPYAAVSLSVDPANPAVRLYERFGFVPVGESGTSITMLKHL